MFAHMFSHEAHHRGQILMLAHQLGYRVLHDTPGVWHWEKLWKQAGLNTRPRCMVTRKSRPSSDWSAVAPRQTITLGRMAAISASSQGRQAMISTAFGFLWMRRLPRGSHLKCFTAFVT